MSGQTSLTKKKTQRRRIPAAAFSLLLPNIRSAHNVGAMFRTADACGVEKIYLAGYTPVPPRPDIHKVALGADEWLAWEHVDDPIPLVSKLKKAGVCIVALEKTEKSVDIGTVAFQKPILLIVGNEVEGISPELLALADDIVHIPMYGKKESLNVSIAGGIGMYVVAKSLRG